MSKSVHSYIDRKSNTNMNVLNQVFVLVVFLFYYTYADPLIVETTYGKIRGSTIPSRLGKTIYSFRGVRFAKPPLGSLRFQPPKNPDSWDGVKDASKDGPSCPQFEASSPTNEDCLYLNVYCTDLNSSSTLSKPVFVFFHPGGWLSFTGRSDLFGPQYLLDRDVVLVTSNYRLGALGFLSSGDGALAGNQALKDQVAVLRWVKDNIASFGGDPDKVTIGGYSVGGQSVILHLVSPMSKGLFKQAIAMSGAAVVDFTLMRNSKDVFRRQAEYLNCSMNVSTQEVVDCLRTKSVEEILNSSTRFYEWYSSPVFWITPEVEKERDDGTERFLVEDPIQSFSSGRFAQDVPLIIGHNLNEFDYAGKDILSNENIIQDLNQNSSYIFPILLMYKENAQKELITARIKEFYLHNQPITKESETAFSHIFSDEINFPVYRAAKLIAEKTKSSIYFYHFSYQGRYSWRYKEDGTTPYGVVHHDDLIYLFYISTFPFFEENDPEIKMIEKYTHLFSNFFNYGNPNGDCSEIIWAPLTKENAQYLEIGNNSLEMHTGWPNYERMQFLDELYPIPQTNV